jgi:hypothetical protein
MLALPSKLAPELAAIKIPAKAQKALKKEVYAALNELALPPDSGLLCQPHETCSLHAWEAAALCQPNRG